MKKIRVIELFAGVGGFRLGLEGYKSNSKPHHDFFETVWFNQWEPATKRQYAHETYVTRFGEAKYQHEFTNIDVAQVTDKVPEHDLLVGGFPCQDYSVAKNLSASNGLEGKKGVLWWSIYDILVKQGDNAPQYLMLENVDRLISSPAKQRGRDFAVILSCLNGLGYTVEWRIVNAGEYGFPQRRRRIFILGYKKGSAVQKKFAKVGNVEKWLCESGLTQKAFPGTPLTGFKTFEINRDPAEVSKSFNLDDSKNSPFTNSGVADNFVVTTTRMSPIFMGKQIVLADILIDEKKVPQEYYINKKDLERWTYLKGGKNEKRKAKSGFEFTYSEGPVGFPDALDKPSRTIITSEGGSTPSRFKHVVKTKKGLRRLTPIELERLCMFPENHTEGNTDTRRAFFMGNALVVGVIDRLGEILIELHSKK